MPEVRYTGGSVYDLRGGPTWTEGDIHAVGDETADRLTSLEKFELVGDDSDSEGDVPAPLSASAADMIDAGECPWCSEYEGDAVGRHASAAHPDEWADYKEDR